MKALEVHSDDPLCAGPSPEDLITQYLTPNELHYIRNHGPVPSVDGGAFRLEVGGLIDRPLALSMDRLKADFDRHSVVTTLQCAGNRRSELHSVAPFEREVMWGGDAIGTAEWAGARLADVLRVANVAPTATHVWFDGLDRVMVSGTETSFGSSIDIIRAMNGDVLLAYEMNGEALPEVHGAPLRVVIPGQIGARSVKWLGRVTVADRPSGNHFQRVSYRVPTPADGETWQPIQESHLNSFIVTPEDGARIKAGTVWIRGYAVPTGTSTIAEVDVSIDDAGWTPATLLDPLAPGTWTRWQLSGELNSGEHELRVRAGDSSGARQTATLRDAWNPKGYSNGAIHTVRVHVE